LDFLSFAIAALPAIAIPVAFWALGEERRLHDRQRD
jgi:hypothetical protein